MESEGTLPCLQEPDQSMFTRVAAIIQKIYNYDSDFLKFGNWILKILKIVFWTHVRTDGWTKM
jgi:hypothetical protein